jgi:hypothetical protein
MFAVVIGIPAQDMPRPAIPSSGLIGYLASPRAREFRKHSNHPLVQQINRLLGEPVNDDVVATPEEGSASVPAAASADAVSSSCGVETGTRFNIEPRTAPAVAPQNEPTVDFLPAAGMNGADLVVGTGNDTRGLFNSLGDSTTGYYVHRNGASSNPCSPDFEGGLPSFRMRLEMLAGSGDPAVDADLARNAVFLVDTRMGSRGTSAIGLFRNTADRLNNTFTCPNGTHSGNAANLCWNTRTAVSARTDALSIFPQVAVDQRPNGSGTGAGDVYVSNILSTPQGIFVVLTACNNTLASCSQTAVISGADLSTQNAHVRVRPDGGVTVVYVNRQEGPAPDFLQLYDIKYVTCTPAGAPGAPTCAAPKLIVREDQPIPSRGGGLGGGSLAVSNFLITTYPKHDHRVGASGVESYVVWDRCKVQNIQGGGVCPDSDIRYALSTNNDTSWNFGFVDTNTGDQYFPAIRADSSNVLNIAYMSAQNDAGLNHRSQVLLRQIPVGLTPDQVTTAVVITSTAMEPSGDFFFGDAYIGNYIGVAARMTPTGRHAYVHHTHTIVNGVYNGVSAPEQNNHLSRFDY